MDIKDFFENFCKKCKENCEKGMIEKKDFFRCLDRDIYIKKDTTENKND